MLSGFHVVAFFPVEAVIRPLFWWVFLVLARKRSVGCVGGVVLVGVFTVVGGIRRPYCTLLRDLLPLERSGALVVAV